MGNLYLVVYVHVRNLGPGIMYSFSSSDFQIKDANGIRYHATELTAAKDCGLKLVNLLRSKIVDGCVEFEVPATGGLEFIYAPFHLEELKPKRYLSFPIRQ